MHCNYKIASNRFKQNEQADMKSAVFVVMKNFFKAC